MGDNLWRKSIGVVGMMLLAFVFVFSQAAWPGQGQQPKEKANTPQSAAAQPAVEKQVPAAATAKPQTAEVQGEASKKVVAEQKPSGGSQEGIKVHGHWTIEVRNPDGKVATQREFENSIFAGSNGGATLLSLLLGRQTLVGLWEIVLTPAGGGPPGIFLDEPLAATFRLKTVSQPQTFCGAINSCSAGDDLSVSGGGYASGVYTGGTLTLTGTATVQPGFTTIGQVVAGNLPCFGNAAILTVAGFAGGNLAPAACAAIGSVSSVNESSVFLNFTSRTLDGQNGDPQPVSVSAGQTIAVTVIISFS
jgi:hypothetical protein